MCYTVSNDHGVCTVTEVVLALTGPDVLQYALNGLSRGMIIFLTASGLTLIFGLIGLINFTHGALFTLGAYVTMSVIQYTGNYWLGLILAVMLVSLLGFVLERSVIYRLYDKEPLLGFLATFGIGPLIMQQAMKAYFGGQTHSVPNPFPGSIGFGPVSYPAYRLFIIVVGLVVALLVGLLLTRTQFGLKIYATSTDTPTAEILAVDTSRIYTATFVLGIALAALAGGLMSPITSITPDLGFSFMLTAFLVVIVGGMGSFKGSFIASLLAGQIISFGSIVMSPIYASMMVFLLAMIVILFRPTGFYGRTEVLG